MSKVLPMKIQRQCCSAWCWAAVISSITQSMASPCGPLQQGEVVSRVLPIGVDCTGCCPDGCPSLEDRCNLPADISFALSSLDLGLSAGQPVTVVGFEGICHQLEQGRPVVAEIDFDDPPGGAHAMLVYGYDAPDLLRIGDPANGESLVVSFTSYSTPEAYIDAPTQVHGTWNSVYFLDGL